MASPIQQLAGENESPGPLSSMKLDSEMKGDGGSNTE